MNEPAPGAPGAPAAPPAQGGSPPAAPPAGGAPPAAPTQRPEWLPENYFDPQAGIKPEFGQHYAEVSKFYETKTAEAAALKARKPEDIKFEVKLPDTVKVPDGMQVKIDDKDPRIPVLRQMALDRGWDQDTVNGLVALDAQQKIEAHNAEVARVAAEDKKLGANGNDRKAAVANWAKALADKGDLTADELAEIRMTATTAAGVTALEKLMAKVNGSVPGAGGHQPTPPKPAEVPIEQRWYPPAQQKAS